MIIIVAPGIVTGTVVAIRTNLIVNANVGIARAARVNIIPHTSVTP